MTPSRLKLLKDYSEALIIAFILAMIVRAFFFEAFKIPTGSMLDTLQVGDFLLVKKFSYGVRLPFAESPLIRFEGPKHGDVVLFEFPKEPEKLFIKRVIGIPGDKIEIRDKVVFRNGEKLEEPYAVHNDPNILQASRDNFPLYIVPDGHYFVLGDNRDYSNDSRYWDALPRDRVKGKAWFIYWSWSADVKVGLFPGDWKFKVNEIRSNRILKAIR